MSDRKIHSALISVYYKDNLEPVVQEMARQGITIYSTGGTQQFIEGLGIPCVPVESLTSYPSILGGRVKTLHPVVFGGILGRRDLPQDQAEMEQYHIPEIDLVIVDLYPFEETLRTTDEEQKIIEKIDIGGPSMIRAAAKNHKDLTVIADKADYPQLLEILQQQNATTSLEQRKAFAAKAFYIVMNYDIAINNYFNGTVIMPLQDEHILRYGENPHQKGVFYGDLGSIFEQVNGKELSYNNLVDVDAAVQLITDFGDSNNAIFAVIKHTNVCGIAERANLEAAWEAALAGDPESAFGGVLVTNKNIDAATAEAINTIFFEVLIAQGYDEAALQILKSKKNRILLINKESGNNGVQFKNALNGILTQDKDTANYEKWEDVGAAPATEVQKADLIFANIVCKHLKSNAIALVKNRQLLGKGCGQTSRIDALRHAIGKAGQFGFDLQGAVMASDAFFPFDDCVRIAKEAGVAAVIQPGGSIRDKDSIQFCKENDMTMVLTGVRHFRH
jgi:phosphoribosylaminoimidazolecarboxamide formyltransferase/IMP cyclohydrolase